MGQNYSGQLGRGFTSSQEEVPAAVMGVTDATRAELGLGNSCVVRGTGALACWGVGTSGELGEGRYTTRHTARAVMTVSGATQVAMGHGHTCALTATDALYCWGRSVEGQVGDGATGYRNAPVLIGSVPDAVDLATGYHTTCVVRRGGSVSCWGENDVGQLGDGLSSHGAGCMITTSGTVDCSPSPVPVTGITDAVDVTAGGEHGCVVHATGGVSCWGDNGEGQLGIGADPLTTPFTNTPMAVGGITDAVQVMGSAWHTCARRSTGAVACWGRNASGELGDGTGGTSGARSLTPVAVVGITDATRLTVDISRSCVLRAAGGPMCWGGNDSGELGTDGLYERWTTPRPLTMTFP
jgi:alpha-tubulin suppressor-like RCC1 family protein